MKKIISIFLALALFISGFSGTLTFSAEDTVVNEVNEMKFGIGITIENDYEAEIIEAKNLGSNIIRISEPDNHDYTRLLKVIAYAEQHGMEIILNCDHINYEFLYDKEASEAAGERLPYTEAADVDVEAIKEHYTTLVNAVKGRVDYWKFGNELDNWYYKTGEQGRVYSEEYYLDVVSAATALSAASAAVKAIDTDAKTLINFGWLHYGFIDGLAQNGFSWDVIGIDWYSSGSYNEEYGPNGNVAQYDYGYVIDYLSTNHSDKEIIICETGLAPNGLDENGDVVYIGDAEWLNGEINDIKTNYADKISAVVVFKLNDPAPSTDEEGNVVYNKEDYYGIIDANGSKKDAYYAVQSAFGGTDDWSIFGGGDVDDIYTTVYKANSQDCYNSGIRVSDYAETVGSRVLYYPTNTALNGNLWTLRYGLNEGVNAFEYDGNVSDGVYTINAATKWAGDNGLKYKVAANTELHIPIVVPTDAISILEEYNLEVSFDNGDSWSEITPEVVETRSFKVATDFNSTMTVYSVSLTRACDFRVLFPQLWYDETIVENEHTPNGDGDSPYDILLGLKGTTGNVYNAAMYILPPTAYSLNVLSLGESDVITADDLTSTAVWTDSTWGNTYIMGNSTQYAKIVGRLAATPHSGNWRWTHYGSKNPYNAESTVYSFVPYYNGENSVPTNYPYIEYNIEKGTIATFDIGLDVDYDNNLTYEVPVRDQFKIQLSVDNGITFNSIDSTNSYYTLNDKGNVRTYNVTITENSILRITFPNVSVMSADVKNSGANSAVSYLYAGAAFVTPVRCTKGILTAGTTDYLSSDFVTTTHIGGNSYTIPGSHYSTVSSLRGAHDFVANLVVGNSSWKWGGINNFTTVNLDGKYVYSPVGTDATNVLEKVPYIDFNVDKDMKITIPIGMYDELWAQCGDGINEASFKFEFAPLGSNEFVEISAADYEVISETQQKTFRYDGKEYKTGNYNLTIKTYSVATPANGVLRVSYPATFAKMMSIIYKYHNEGVNYISLSSAAFIVPPTAENISYGDVNGDGVIDAIDIVRTKKFVAQVEGITLDKLAANLDNVSGVNSGDLIVLRDYIMGNIKNFK